MLRKFLSAAGIFVAVQLTAFGLIFVWQLEAIDSMKEQEARLKETYVRKMNQAANLNFYRGWHVELDRMLGELLDQLPPRFDDPDFTPVRRLANAQGLRIDVLRPAPAETRREFYAQWPVQLELTGPFHKIAAFAAELTQLRRITVMGPFSIERSPVAGMVTLKSVISTFRYVDEEELAALRAAPTKAQ